MKRIFSMIIIFSAIIILPGFITLAQQAEVNENRDNERPVEFREVWGYLMRGEENVFKGDEPVTDICYFSCELDANGRINTDVNRPVLKELNGRKRRVHVVIANLEGFRIMRHILNPVKGARELLVKDIIEVSKEFDGVQIDFEAVSPGDAENFLAFLGMIKTGLEPGKTLSVALLPKKSRANDAYDYRAISSIVDRVFVMAYDQHWSTSRPGPVASLPWCISIMTFAINEIPAEKLIMGLPLYGRSWQNVKVVERIRSPKKQASKKKTVTRTRYVTRSRSVKTGNLHRLISDKNSIKEYSVENGFKIRYKGRSGTIVYCDDVNSISEKFLFYSRFVDSIGFWRLGMENTEMWKVISVKL